MMMLVFWHQYQTIGNTSRTVTKFMLLPYLEIILANTLRIRGAFREIDGYRGLVLYHDRLCTISAI